MEPLSGLVLLKDPRGGELYLNLAQVAAVEFAKADGPISLDRSLHYHAVITTAAGGEKLQVRGREALMLRRELRRQAGLPEEEGPGA